MNTCSGMHWRMHQQKRECTKNLNCRMHTFHSLPPQPEPHRKIAIAVNPAPAIPPAFPYYFPRCNQINLQLRPSSFHIFKNIFPLPLYVACNFLMNIQTMTTPPAFRPREPHQKLRPQPLQVSPVLPLPTFPPTFPC